VGLGKEIVFAKHAGFIKQVLQKEHRKYQKSTLQTVDLAKYIGHGILTANGGHWKTHRRMVQPAFHKQKLCSLLNTMHGAILQELKRIRPNTLQDVYPLMGDLAFQVVAKSLFSRDDIQKEMEELKEITEANQRMLIKEMRQPYLNWWYRLSGKIGHHLQLSQRARDILVQIIAQRKAQKEDHDDLLDMLLKAKYEDGTPMSQKQLLDEVLILFTAGFETTANALSFTLYLLATHPSAQEKAYQEVSVLDLKEGFTMEVFRNLVFIKQCIEESLRLYPPAYYIDRECIVDDEIDGYAIPKNTMLLLAIYELHRDDQFWESPHAFIPERFDAPVKKDTSDHYFPFGAGPRMCVGNNFAMQEMIMAIACILQEYKVVSSGEDLKLNPLISLKPEAVNLHFIRR
jgi:cytochrome P450